MRSLSLLLLASLVPWPVMAPAQEAGPLVADPTPAATCPVPAPEGWTRHEAWAWRQICAGRVADMQRAAGEIDAMGCDAGDVSVRWPDRRRLSASFVATVARGEVGPDMPALTTIRIRCARIDGRIALVEKVVAPSLAILDSRVRGGVDLSDAAFGRDVAFSGSLLSANGGSFVDTVSRVGLLADGVTVGGDLGLNDMPGIGQVRLVGAKIVGNVAADRSTFTGPFTADRMAVGGSLFLQDMPSAGEVRLLGAKIDGQVSARGSTFTGPFNADSMEVGGSLLLRDMPSVAEVVLLGAKVGGQVSANGSTFTGLVTADGMEVGGGLFLRDMPSVAELRLRGAKIGGQVSVERSAFTGPVTADGIEVGRELFLRDMVSAAELRLLGATISGNVEADGAAFAGAFQADRMEVDGGLLLRDMQGAGSIGLPGLRVRGGLQLHGSAVSGAVNLTGARIDGALELWQGGEDVAWQEGAALILRNASAGALQARMPESWRLAETGAPVPFDLQGFVYDRLGGNRSGAFHDLARSNDAEALVAWLKAERPPGMAAVTAYGPQPYRQLADVLRAQGAEAQADRVDFARLMHRRATRFGDAMSTWDHLVAAFRWTVDTLALVLVGFGVYPGVALGWFLGLVWVGTIVGRFSPDLAGRTLWTRLWYSLENALPLIEPSGRFAGITHLGAGGRTTRVANFFHFQKVAGFLLATVLIGALTLLSG